MAHGHRHASVGGFQIVGKTLCFIDFSPLTITEHIAQIVPCQNRAPSVDVLHFCSFRQ